MNENHERPATQDSLAFLAGGGEMGERIRTFDWSSTPLGPVEDWPQSLRSAVSICLNTSFPIALYWGSELVLLYNDSWSPIPGAKHPWSLGRPAREAWPEIWDIISPLFTQVMTAGEATRRRDQLLPMRRHGFTEECYFDYTFSPVRGESGGVLGVFNAVIETTTRVIGERRLHLLRELGAGKAGDPRSAEDACQSAAHILAENPNDLPFVLLYLLESDGRRASLAGVTGLEWNTPAGPASVDLDDPEAPWPFRQVAETGEAVEVADLLARFGPLPGGGWPEAPERAVVLPMVKPGQRQPAGFVVAGVSPRLALDDDYKGFLGLLAGHVATGVAKARAYEEERRRAEALAELDRAKTTFFSNLSHEFRTPLTLMLGPVEDMLSKPEAEVLPDNRELLGVIQRNGLRLLRLVNTLLDFSRIEAGRVQATYQPTDLAAFTAELASNFRSACERAGLRLVVECPSLSEPVYVDHQMWEKVVLNLLSNAFKFTFEGEIAVSLRQVGNVAEFRVQDTGTGIPAEEMPRLFERFHRIENARSRTHEGSGIGLALVQELVKLHGGAITAASTVGEGTTFTVTIPLGTAHLPPERVEAERAARTALSGANPYVEEALRWLPGDGLDERDDPADPGAGLRNGLETGLGPGLTASEGEDRGSILVADDNADMRQYVTRLLAGEYHVEAVADGELALRAARERPPDLILSDVMMPRLDGFALLRELRADPRLRHVPVILLSARAGEESRVEGVEAGADDYLVKPFSARELLARVSAHLQLARLRRESGEQFRALVDASSDAVYRMNADWTEMRYLQGREFTQGREFIADTHEPSSTWLERYIHPDDQAHVSAAIEEAIRTKSAFQLEHRVLRADGRLGWTFPRAVPLLGKGGEVLEWLGMASDVTPRKEAEAALRRSQEQLSEELEATTRLHALSTRLLSTSDLPTALEDVLKNAIVTGGADFGNIQLFNPETQALEIVAQRGFRAEFLEYFHTVRVDDGSACAQAMQSGARIVIEDVKLDPTYQRHLGIAASAGYRAVQSTPLKTGAGVILGMLSTHFRAPRTLSDRDQRLLDLYARHAADLIERLRYEEALKEADRRKDEFLAILAHELRNPLAPLRNGLQVLKLTRDDAARVERTHSMMERQLGQMVRLIDDLLDLSRISRGKIKLKRERVELAQIVQHAVEASRPLIQANELELILDIPTGRIWVDADVTRLTQVLTNLLNNATKYTQPGGLITLTVQQQGHEAVVSVRDTGVGIPAAMLPRLFEMFTQVDRSLERSQGGLGIGLSLVKGLVEMHGGSVEARSEGLGHGSEFLVRLPVVLMPAASEEDDARENGATGHKRRILVVDDNRDAALSLALMLELMGNETKTAFDGLEALEVAAAFRPDVVLLDIGMPKLNGYDAARRLRQQPWGQHVLLVACTGWGQEEDRRQSQEAGLNYHLVKPVEPAAIEKLLAEL